MRNGKVAAYKRLTDYDKLKTLLDRIENELNTFEPTNNADNLMKLHNELLPYFRGSGSYTPDELNILEPPSEIEESIVESLATVIYRFIKDDCLKSPNHTIRGIRSDIRKLKQEIANSRSNRHLSKISIDMA